MMKTRKSAQLIARQVGRSDLTMRRCCDQRTEETSFPLKPGSKCLRQISHQKILLITWHVLSESTASLTAVQTQTEPSLRAPVSYLTTAKCLDEGHVCTDSDTHRPTPPFEVASRTMNRVATEWNQVVFSHESGLYLSNDDNLVHVWRLPRRCLNPAFNLQRHTSPIANVMAWVAIGYYTRSTLILFYGTMKAPKYVHDILQPHVLPLMAGLPGVILKQQNAWPHMVVNLAFLKLWDKTRIALSLSKLEWHRVETYSHLHVTRSRRNLTSLTRGIYLTSS
ncbi:transposable element Tcb2 transposase [Trichonephila clavipes]|nr:transposable element Tcb2 transposase [Trichonephila clavipes]